MQFDRFTEEAQEVAQRAASIIERYQHNLIDTEHILMALIRQTTGMMPNILLRLKVDIDLIDSQLNNSFLKSPKAKNIGDKKQIYITPRVKRIIDLANEESLRLRDEFISTEHMFLAILTERDTPAALILKNLGISHQKTLETIIKIRNGKKLVTISEKKLLVKEQTPSTSRPNSNKVLSKKTLSKNKNVFIVHGHDDAMKEAVARTIEKLGLKAIILHEKPNQGKTIIEKFTDYSDVGFAIVLLSPDDIASSKYTAESKKYFRARQNVIFELGFFIGKLGRNRVVSLYRQTEDFELPTDYSGVLFIPFDDYHRWKFDVIKELKASGYELDANKLIE